ncbi:hypothetical protein DNTS_031404 [Danionella cerebrum]|uniref:Pseudouridylate synthase RPUSD4, mitochondrial n=1 Tax=Danionella cerebrum TaxID=2873325 RepID=A0A553RAL0_9TELE|nr:hypothetical protein DNTS_031404 [Danionella translucida]
MQRARGVTFARLLRAYATSSKAETSASNAKPGLRAIDIANRLRKEKEDLKNSEKRVPMTPLQARVDELKQFSQRLQNIHPCVLTKALYKSRLYEDQNIIAVNKPYGVPLHSVNGIRNSIAGCLPMLAKVTNDMQPGALLQFCHTLEKDTTGVLIIAKTNEAVEHVQTHIRSRQMEVKYLAVTVGVPVPSEGVIDIPIIEKEVPGPKPLFKMALSPLFKVNEAGDGVTRVRGQRQSQNAVTHYRVLNSTAGCSLVELQPVTGVKNQLRVHMAFALSCPILGDHKYSDWNKLAPQRLPQGTLQRLGLEQSKTRYLPLHVHCKSIILPGFKGHHDIELSCPPPKYFTRSMKRLNIVQLKNE